VAGVYQNGLDDLTSTQIEYLCDKFEMEEDELLSASEERLDEIYDELCDLECALTPLDDSKLSFEAKVVSDIVTLLGNSIAEANGYFDEDDEDDEE